jgi:hypothetical protein
MLPIKKNGILYTVIKLSSRALEDKIQFYHLVEIINNYNLLFFSKFHNPILGLCACIFLAF